MTKVTAGAETGASAGGAKRETVRAVLLNANAEEREMLYEQLTLAHGQEFVDGLREVVRREIASSVVVSVRPGPVVDGALRRNISLTPKAFDLVAPVPLRPVVVERRDFSALIAKEKTEAARIAALVKAVMAPPAAKAPEPEVAPEPAKAEPEPKPEAKPNAGPLILNPSSPLDSAREFVQRECHGPDGKTNLYHWQGQFYQWNGVYYRLSDTELLEGQVLAFLDVAMKYAGGNAGLVRFQPGSRHVNEVIYALSKCLALGRDFAPPSWFPNDQQPDGAAARDMIVFRNGVVSLRTGEFSALTSRLWVHSALEFDWDPNARCPQWDKFLGEVFPGDQESIEFLEEWMGYCMTEETRFQKGVIFVGPKRSGKGTITHVIQQLVGDRNYVGLSFDRWTSTENSQAPMIGKRVGVFADVRLKPAKAFGATGYDVGGLNHISQGLLLNIIGEDRMTVGRKNIGAWEGRLPIKLMMISNEVPNLNDPSGALIGRFVKLRFGVSFFGREDVGLKERLDAELPGIAARCVAAYRRLCARGRIVQPQSGLALDRAVLAESDPFTAMILDCFVADTEDGGMVSKLKADSVFEAWCRDHGRMDVYRSVPKNKFGERLTAVDGFAHVATHRPNGQPRCWLGMKLKPKAKD